jgi:hypothetical protein
MICYSFAKDGCGNPVLLNGKKIYFQYNGINSISKDEMDVYAQNKKFKNGWLENNDFYIVDKIGMQSHLFLKLCQIGNN